MAKLLSFPVSRTLSERDALVEAHLGLVRSIAIHLARTLPPSFPVDDLIGTGNLELIRLAEKYEPAKNDNFAAYARQRIRGAMLDSVKRRAWINGTMAPIENLAGEQPASDCRIEAELENSQLWELVGQLSSPFREILELQYRDGLNREQLALRLGIRPRACGTLHKQAIEQIQFLLSPLPKAA